ncbi:TPA: hypothetical protein DEP21_06180 [Patescibacteria group bacterium]|nr:hypothetical protein [Candidatus Gracilibacteria bacterium]
MAQQNHSSQQRPGVSRPNNSFVRPNNNSSARPANSSHFQNNKPNQHQNKQQFAGARVPMVFVNENIKAPNIVIIDEEGKNL